LILVLENDDLLLRKLFCFSIDVWMMGETKTIDEIDEIQSKFEILFESIAKINNSSTIYEYLETFRDSQNKCLLQVLISKKSSILQRFIY
jgi:hypothetical protein